MSEKKTIYKAKYEIEIEIIRKRSQDGRYIQTIPEVNIKQEVMIRDFDSYDEDLSQLCDYIEKHFPGQIEALYATMYALEGLVLSFDSLDARSKAREEVISAIGKLVQSNLRKRLITTKGRKPNKEKYDYENYKNHFLIQAGKIIKNIQNEGKKITRTSLAERMFDNYSNPLRELRNRLNLYGISFQELIKK